VQYYNAILKVIANVAAATTIAASEKKKTIPDRRNWGAKYRLFCADKRQLYF
jgi:hypothetical protein